MADKPGQRVKPHKKILCKGCDQEIRQVIELEIECPLGWIDFTKHGVMSAHVQIEGARWESAVWRCGCGVREPDSMDTRPSGLKRQAPPDPDSRTVRRTVQ